MRKQEIEKMFNTCNNYYSCALCPYNPEDISRFIGDKWVGGCPDKDRKLVYAMSKDYRKAEEVRKETAKEIFKSFENAFSLYYPHGILTYEDFQNHFMYLAKQYSVEVEE